MDNEGNAGGSSAEEERVKLPNKGDSQRKFDKHRKTIKAKQAKEKGKASLANEAENASSQESQQVRVAQLTDLSKRVTELEIEIARLQPETQAAPEESLRFRQLPLTPPYVSRAVVAVEDHLADMERFAATGDEAAAQKAKVAAAMRCCSTLRRLCDDDDFLQMLVTMKNRVERLSSDRPVAG